jgi:hypothetical protein
MNTQTIELDGFEVEIASELRQMETLDRITGKQQAFRAPM